jgi:mono/diheme cytochrome c family protein
MDRTNGEPAARRPCHREDGVGMVRGSLLLAGVLVLFMLPACDKKQTGSAGPNTQASAQTNAQASNAELEGEWLYENNCAECHETLHPDLLKQPPNLHGLFRRRVLPSGTPLTDAQIRTTIIEGRGTMPAFDQRLRDVDVANLIRFLQRLN